MSALSRRGRLAKPSGRTTRLPLEKGTGELLRSFVPSVQVVDMHSFLFLEFHSVSVTLTLTLFVVLGIISWV